MKEKFSLFEKRKTPHCAVETDPSNRIETSGAHPAAFDFLFIKACRPPSLGYRSIYIALRSEDFVSIHEHGRVNSFFDPQIFNERTPTPSSNGADFQTPQGTITATENSFKQKNAIPFFFAAVSKKRRNGRSFGKRPQPNGRPIQARRLASLKRISFAGRIGQTLQPIVDQPKHRRHLDALIYRRISGQVVSSQSQQSARGTKPILLQMNERSRQLDEPLVKQTFGTLATRQPQRLQNVMRLVEQPPIETGKEPQVVRGPIPALQLRNQNCHLRAFMTHPTAKYSLASTLFSSFAKTIFRKLRQYSTSNFPLAKLALILTSQTA